MADFALLTAVMGLCKAIENFLIIVKVLRVKIDSRMSVPL